MATIKEMVEERVKNVPVVMRSGFHQLCRNLYIDGANAVLSEIEKCMPAEEYPADMIETYLKIKQKIKELKG